ncbi:MAG TPA: membrane-bound lytic murein transglycosylase MltF [Casimicrobiaceae bacterium]|nr:membrane-bound lytic murein transglycosylase MltF [Casimicrobiaceae bacterium]
MLAVAALGTLASCDRAPDAPAPVPPQRASDELVVLVRPGPATFYEGVDGQPAGFDADLVRMFAARKKLVVRFVPVTSATELIADIAQGKAHLGAGGLFRPGAHASLAARLTHTSGSTDSGPQVLWTSGYFNVEPVLIYSADGFRPASWKDLDGERVTYMRDTGLDADFERLREGHPGVQWEALDVASGDALIAQVSDGARDYAIVPSNVAALSRNIYLGFDVAFAVDGHRELAWALPQGEEKLRDEINAWFAEIRRNGTLERIIERHFGHSNEVPRMDAGIFQERIHSILPQFRQAFESAQQATGVEWRLLAAVAYQESQWDPHATSETGVRGMMQLTEETARHLGVVDRLDPKLSIDAAARYLRDLKQKLPSRIQEPDRTWLALAAFNIGLGHLEDARILAQKQKLNPDLWTDVKKTLPLLAQPEHYENAKLGYARGGMPVAFVDRVRTYYDVLLAHEPVYRPRLQVTVRGPREEPAPVLP